MSILCEENFGGNTIPVLHSCCAPVILCLFWIFFSECWYLQTAQWAHNAIMSLLRQSDVTTSFWRNNDIIASCVCWERLKHTFHYNAYHWPIYIIHGTTQMWFFLSYHHWYFSAQPQLPSWSMYIAIHPRNYPHFLLLYCCLSLQWRYNERDGISNHQPHNCLFNRFFRRRAKKISRHCITVLWAGNSPVTGEFPAQRASNVESVSIWWRHHVTGQFYPYPLGITSLARGNHMVSIGSGNGLVLNSTKPLPEPMLTIWLPQCQRSNPVEYG